MSSKFKKALLVLFCCLVVSLPAKSNTMRAVFLVVEGEPQLTILRLPSYRIISYTLPLEDKVFLFSEEPSIVDCKATSHSVFQLQGFKESDGNYIRFDHFIVLSKNDESYVRHLKFDQSDLNRYSILNENGKVAEKLCDFFTPYSKYNSTIAEIDTSNDLYLADLLHIGGREYLLYFPNFKNIKISIDADGGAEVTLLKKQQFTCSGESRLAVPIQFAFTSAEGKRLYQYYFFDTQAASLASLGVSTSPDQLFSEQLCEEISKL
ncbi:hypothetical protein FE845_04570 [Marinobacter sp. 1-4A]|uniref:hypothetical protein n=1 Tax=Marinobacter sp. 1-4A TaxID=2582919 RepID=UPI0019075D73|nr:hypothetical protein [Marinobacter sp. 1-4A]MBK1850600.1 hypothetical protein [Marinobacter sp. 1-4A]